MDKRRTYRLLPRHGNRLKLEGQIAESRDSVSPRKPKKLLVDMNCAADVPVVQKKIDMLITNIVTQRHLGEMMPAERFGLFDVAPDAESEFRTMAGQQGLTVLEVRT